MQTDRLDSKFGMCFSGTRVFCKIVSKVFVAFR